MGKQFETIGKKVDKGLDSGPVFGEKKRKLTPKRFFVGSMIVGAAFASVSVMASEQDASSGDILRASPEGAATGLGVATDITLDTASFVYDGVTGILREGFNTVGLEEVPRMASDVRDFATGNFSDGRNAVNVDFDFSFDG